MTTIEIKKILEPVIMHSQDGTREYKRGEVIGVDGKSYRFNTNLKITRALDSSLKAGQLPIFELTPKSGGFKGKTYSYIEVKLPREFNPVQEKAEIDGDKIELLDL